MWPNAELIRSRRGQRPDEAQEQRIFRSRRKQKGRRLSAPVKGWASTIAFSPPELQQVTAPPTNQPDKAKGSNNPEKPLWLSATQKRPKNYRTSYQHAENKGAANLAVGALL
jgi:hypothetical protein